MREKLHERRRGLFDPPERQMYAGRWPLGRKLDFKRYITALMFMKPTKTKRELRDELQQQMNDYLHHGGAVNAVPQGVSGREDTRAPLPNIFTGQGSEDRTLVPDVVAAIESRRHASIASKTRYKPRPKKKIILDDFGQPLRWEWVEE